jgi:hypothetical protein
MTIILIPRTKLANLSEGTKIPLLLHYLDFNFVNSTIRTPLCVKCINKIISLFHLTTLSLKLYLYKHHVFLASSSLENQKSCRIFQMPSFKNGWMIPPESVTFLLAMDFLMKRIADHTSNFMEKLVLYIYRTTPRVLGLSG